MLAACQTTGDRQTIARLRHERIEIKAEKIDGGLEKAMQTTSAFFRKHRTRP